MSDLVDDLVAKGDPEGPDFESDVLDRLKSLHRSLEGFRLSGDLGHRDLQDDLRDLRATQLRHGEMLQKLLAGQS